MSVRLTRERSRVRAPLLPLWGISAVGSALHSHCKGHGFESRILHFIKEYRKIIGYLRYSLYFYRYYTSVLFSCKESINISLSILSKALSKVFIHPLTSPRHPIYNNICVGYFRPLHIHNTSRTCRQINQGLYWFRRGFGSWRSHPRDGTAQ